MTWARLASLALLLGLSGCAGPDDAYDGLCPERNYLGRVAAINGTTVEVQVLVPVDEYVVLHTEGAGFHYYAGSTDSCYEAFRENLTVGQEIEFYADAWAKSLPPQATVEDIVIRG